MPLVIFTRQVPHWRDAVAIDVLIDAGPEAVDALVDVDAGLHGLVAKIGARGNFNFLVFFNKLDNRHIDGP